jgi:DNA-directed RNA polymerase sigma subunit (sigma70/sigma32)
MQQLTPGQQEVLVLRFGEGRKIREVGRLLGKSEGSVKLLQYRALNRLKTLLEEQGRKDITSLLPSNPPPARATFGSHLTGNPRV